MHIVVHSKTHCPFCQLAKQDLTARGLAFEEILYDDDDAAKQAMYDSFGLVGGQRTVPQIVVDGVRLGGYQDLKEHGVPRADVGQFDADF